MHSFIITRCIESSVMQRNTDVDESTRTEQQIARETYSPNTLPDFDVYCAVVNLTAETLTNEGNL